MCVPLLPLRCIRFTALAAGLFFLAEAPIWAQAVRQGAAPQPTAPVPAAPSLFPEPEPRLVEKASLQGLLKALGTQDHESVTQMTWQLLAAMATAKGQGIGPS